MTMADGRAKNGLSRRSFLRGSALTTASASLLEAASSLVEKAEAADSGPQGDACRAIAHDGVRRQRSITTRADPQSLLDDRPIVGCSNEKG